MAGKLYKNFRGKQKLYNCRLYNEHMGTKLVFIVKFYFKCVSDSLHYKQFGKVIVKYNAFYNFTLFCSISEPKGVLFTL